mmetsp:Transcript_86125/g.256992  ORF Transcript_86125/g.256992 Transcript_86125/m.256992 type:complete len:209 (-) Transcript_86125:258-884(-)
MSHVTGDLAEVAPYLASLLMATGGVAAQCAAAAPPGRAAPAFRRPARHLREGQCRMCLAAHLAGHECQAAGRRGRHPPAEGHAQRQDPHHEAAGREGSKPERQGRLRLHGAPRGLLHRERRRVHHPPGREGERRRAQQERLHLPPGRRPRGAQRGCGGPPAPLRGRRRRWRQGLDAALRGSGRGPRGGLPDAPPERRRRRGLCGRRAL